jgi:nicotinate-nucleotide adenylyltransferase
MKIGVLGGSFDPIHNGHLVAAQQVANRLGLQQVLFVPAGNQWQKTQLAGVQQTDAKHRLAMTQLAIAGNSLFSLCPIDVDRGGSTYTVDTLKELRETHANDELFFILGADAIAGIESWKDSEKLFDFATFVAVSRPGYQLQVPERFKDRVIQIQMESLDLSSTECRDKAVVGQDLTGLVPDAVITYIRENNLYQEAK